MGRLLGSREVRQWAPEPPVPPFPGTNMYGQASVASRPDSALVVPTVWACVGLVANTVSMLTLETFREAGGIPQKITSPQVVKSPCVGMTQSMWLHQLIVSLLLRGNFYGLVTSRDAMQRPTQILPLHPDKVRVRVDDQTGAVEYLLGTSQQDRSRDMFHVPGMMLPGAHAGLSPIAYAAATIGLNISARKFAADFYDGGGLPKGKLKSDQTINQEQAVTLKERLRAATANREPVILGQGVDYETIPVRAEESQFLKTQQFGISEIARFFFIPAEKVGGTTGSSLTYTTTELNNLDFLTYGVGWLLKRVEDCYNAILPEPQYTAFKLSMLLRTDQKTQVEVDAINVAAKIRPPSEIRRERGLPPLTEAEKTELSLVPLAVTPNQGTPKALPKPPTPETYPDAPVESPPGKPKLGVVANG